MHNTIFSPARIKILLEIYLDDSVEYKGTPIRTETIGDFLEHEIIDFKKGSIDTYELTLKGRAWIQSICDVEMPKVAFTDKAGELINAT